MSDSKCIVKGCKNRKGEGDFMGDICNPCYHTITTGKVGYGHAWWQELKEIELLKHEVKCLKYLIEEARDERDDYRNALLAWWEATRSDPSLSGPRFKGISYSKAEKAWELTLTVLENHG